MDRGGTRFALDPDFTRTSQGLDSEITRMLPESSPY